MEVKDTYKTITKESEELLYKEKGSKFFATAFPVLSEENISEALEKLRAKHHKARHFCYAWQLGTEQKRYRANDDGEPSNSAGMPIYGQLQAFDVTNVLVVVVRYFGGTKLGVGGLISAYKIATKMVLETTEIVQKTIDFSLQLTFEYQDLNKLMRIIKEQQLVVVSQKMESNCEYVLSIRKGDFERIHQLFEDLRCVKLKTL